MKYRHRILGTMVTMTTYGTWLRGDQRGWVDDGVILPASPVLEANDLERLAHPPFFFDVARLFEVGDFIGRSLVDRAQQRVYALAVQTWHVHFLVGPTSMAIADVVKCAKDAARYGLRPGRPIWTEGYDKRFCTEESSLQHRIAYVERHNTELGFPPRPWTFLS
jgi:hypothetical protein